MRTAGFTGIMRCFIVSKYIFQVTFFLAGVLANFLWRCGRWRPRGGIPGSHIVEIILWNQCNLGGLSRVFLFTICPPLVAVGDTGYHFNFCVVWVQSLLSSEEGIWHLQSAEFFVTVTIFNQLPSKRVRKMIHNHHKRHFERTKCTLLSYLRERGTATLLLHLYIVFHRRAFSGALYDWFSEIQSS